MSDRVIQAFAAADAAGLRRAALLERIEEGRASVEELGRQIEAKRAEMDRFQADVARQDEAMASALEALKDSGFDEASLRGMVEIRVKALAGRVSVDLSDLEPKKAKPAAARKRSKASEADGGTRQENNGNQEADVTERQEGGETEAADHGDDGAGGTAETSEERDELGMVSIRLPVQAEELR